jgi:signal transduction histidine kinase
MPGQKTSHVRSVPAQPAQKNAPAKRRRAGNEKLEQRAGQYAGISKQKDSPPVELKLRILVLEDNLQDRELIRSQLENENIECELIFTNGRADFEAAIDQGGFDLILSDYSLPQYDGLLALRLLRQKQPDLPFILISGTLGEEQAVECLKLGATDYILKQRLARLGSAVRRAWKEAEARARQRRADEALRELSGRLLRLQDEERRRIARELHNTLAQNLLALALNLNFAQRLVPPNEGQLESAMVECVNLADDTAKALRHVSYLLHPPTLDSIGLPGALSDYVTGFSRRTGIAVELQVSKEFGRLPVEIETALYRVVQESLTNVQSHSGSASAKVELHRNKDRIVVEIQDAGRGIPSETLRLPRNPGSIGVGIAGMHERLQLLQGRLEIESSPAGTRVRATVPNRVTT